MSCLVFSERCLCCVSVPWVERVSVRHAKTQSEQAAHPVAVCCIKSAHHACESNTPGPRVLIANNADPPHPYLFETNPGMEPVVVAAKPECAERLACRPHACAARRGWLAPVPVCKARVRGVARASGAGVWRLQPFVRMGRGDTFCKNKPVMCDLCTSRCQQGPAFRVFARSNVHEYTAHH